MVQIQAETHFRDGTSEDIDIAAGVMPTQGAAVKTETRLYMVKRVPGPTRPSEKHSGKIHGVDAHLAALDFERIVVAHGDPMVEDAGATFRRIIGGHGFLLD